jgi:transposase
MTTSCAAGIDVSKARLDVFVLPKRLSLAVTNDDDGIGTLSKRLQREGVERVVLEATGGLEYAAARRLSDAGIAVSRVQPGRVRAFRRFIGRLAKTDALDAELMARFALAMPDDVDRAIPSRHSEAIRSLSARRRQIVDLLVQEKTRLKSCRDAFVLESLKITIAALNSERRRIENALQAAIEADEPSRHRSRLLRSIPGIGAIVAGVLISDLPELGGLNRHQVASLSGLAPHPDTSGTSRHSGHIRGGRSCVRAALYMAAISAIRCNPSHRAYYKQLIADGKPQKVAIIAVARKLVVLANAIIKADRPWIPAPVLD